MTAATFLKIPSTPLAVGSASWSHSSAHAIHSSTPRPSISAADPVSIDRNVVRKSRTAAGSCQSCANSLNFRHRLASRLRRCCSSYRRLSASWRSRSLPLDPCVVERAMVRQRRKWPECQAACPPLAAFRIQAIGAEGNRASRIRRLRRSVSVNSLGRYRSRIHGSRSLRACLFFSSFSASHDAITACGLRRRSGTTREDARTLSASSARTRELGYRHVAAMC